MSTASKGGSEKKSTKSRKTSRKKTSKKRTSSNKLIYLDNNGTTLICPEAETVYKKWLKCYNASSSSSVSKSAKQMMEKVKKNILKHCSTTQKDYTVVFTSGATESNCFILRSTAEAYSRIKKVKPHIIISSIEHHSILECAKSMVEAGYAEISKVEPNMYGCILPEDVEKEIKPNTCLISIMYANNETGAINNIPKIGEIAHAKKIPLHSDSVQLFGKYPVNLKKSNLDVFSASFHKLYGPKGIGLLIIKNDLVKGYDIKGQICGSQQEGLRGGTENLPAIASSAEALKCAFKNRKSKNAKLLKMRNYIIDNIIKSKLVKLGKYCNYLGDPIPGKEKDNEIVILGPPRDKPNYYLPNTLLLSVAKNKGKEFCNVDFKKDLDEMGIVLSIASACLTSSDKASHILTAIGAPPVIKRGTLRISVGDYNTMEEIKIFVKKFLTLLKDHLAK
jgi:cysteine desulfurase